MSPKVVGAAALGLAVGCCLQGCSKKTPAEEPLQCAQLQQRAEACETQTLAIVRESMARSSADGAKGQPLQFEMFEIRFKKRLHEKSTQKQCEKFQGGGDPSYAKRVDAMKRCYAEAGCDAFAKCMLEL